MAERLGGNGNLGDVISEQYNGFEGEQNLGPNGKPRTDTTFDLYPKQEGETNEAYGERLKWMQAKTAEVEAAERQAEYAESAVGKWEANVRENWQAKGFKSLEEAERMIADVKERAAEKARYEAAMDINNASDEDRRRFEEVVGKSEEEAIDESESAEKGVSRAELLVIIGGIDYVWLADHKVENGHKLNGLSDEDLARLIDEYNASKEEDGGDEKKEMSREELLDLADGIDGIWLKDYGILNRNELEKLSDEELLKLVDDYTKPPEAEEGESGKEGNKVEYDATLGVDRRAQYEDIAENVDLSEIRAALAELYARNRRLIRGGENIERFEAAKKAYSELLTKKLQNEARGRFNGGQEHINSVIDARLAELQSEIEAEMERFIGPDPENSDKTQEEVDAKLQELKDAAMATLGAEYEGMQSELQNEIEAEFQQAWLDETNALEKETIDKLDNGTICRKIVSKVLNNKWIRRGLVVVGVGALAVTGVGLATGALAATYSLTAAGAAAGAAKGAGFGVVGSRQDSKNSEVRGFGVEEIDAIPEEIKNIDILSLNPDEQNVAKFLMDDYSKRNATDRSSNIRKTLKSALVGGAVGAVASGLHIGANETATSTATEQVGEQQVVTGSEQVLTGYAEQVGQMPNLPDVVSGDNINSYINRVFNNKGWTNELNQWLQGVRGSEYGTTVLHPGSINGPANEGALKLIMEYARQHLPTVQVPIYEDVLTYGTEPIYDTVTTTSTKFIENLWLSRLAQNVPVVVAAFFGGKRKKENEAAATAAGQESQSA